MTDNTIVPIKSKRGRKPKKDSNNNSEINLITSQNNEINIFSLYGIKYIINIDKPTKIFFL